MFYLALSLGSGKNYSFSVTQHRATVDALDRMDGGFGYFYTQP